jgi:succinate dehydrogenase/fumarate reductase iron-sulfur protein
MQIPMVKEITAVIFRYDPDSDERPSYQKYSVPARERMLVGDVLEYIHENIDGGLAYRWECRMRLCGGCTIWINGKPGLICREQAEDGMVLEPLPFLPIVRDLVVDRKSLLDKIYAVRPLTRQESPSVHPEPIDPEAILELRVPRQCVQCLACVAVCPATEALTADLFLPPKLIQIAGFAIDGRDRVDRVQESEESNLFDCACCHACEEVCPHEIDISEKVITALRHKTYERGVGHGGRYIKAFRDTVQTKGKISASSVLLKSQGYLRAIMKAPQGVRLIARGKFVSPFEKSIPDIEDIRTIIKSAEREK